MPRFFTAQLQIVHEQRPNLCSIEESDFADGSQGSHGSMRELVPLLLVCALLRDWVVFARAWPPPAIGSVLLSRRSNVGCGLCFIVHAWMTEKVAPKPDIGAEHRFCPDIS